MGSVFPAAREVDPPAALAPAGRAVRRTWRLPACSELALDLVDQLFVQVHEAAEEVDHEQQILLPVR